MPRQLLLLSYFFPPFGGAGVQRALKLCHAAGDHDWQVTVVAAEPSAGEAQDPSMLADVPQTLEVVRTDAFRIGRLGTWASRWTAPDPYLGWYPYALDAAEDLLRSRHFDAVMSTSMPYTAHLVARVLKRDFGLPWLADLRDPWTDNRFMAHYHDRSPSARWRQWLDGKLERDCYTEADRVSVTAGPLRQLLIDKHGLADERVWLVPNGYDEQDFAGILPPPAPRPAVTPELRAEATLEVLFAGSIYTGYTIEPFFAALQRLLERRPEVRLKFVAYTQNLRMLQDFIARYPLAGARSSVGPRVGHREIVARYGQADLMILSALDDLSVPGKLFEYIRSGTPVLAFTTPAAAAGPMLERTGTGWAVAHDDVAAGALRLEQIYDAWASGQPLTQPVPAEVARLERRVAFAELFRGLDELVVASP